MLLRQGVEATRMSDGSEDWSGQGESRFVGDQGALIFRWCVVDFRFARMVYAARLVA